MSMAIERSGVEKSFGKTHIIQGVDLKIKENDKYDMEFYDK